MHPGGRDEGRRIVVDSLTRTAGRDKGEVLYLLLMGLIIIMSILTGELLGKRRFLETLRSG